MSARTLLALAASILAGCASLSLPEDVAAIAPKTKIVVPALETADRSTTVVQSIVARYRDRAFTFDAQIQITPETFDLVALDGFGRRTLTVHCHEGAMKFDVAPWLPSVVRPADILADIAIVYGSKKAVTQSVAGAGAILTETDTSRIISRGNRDLVVVEYGNGHGWSRPARLKNLAFGYEIDIQSAELAP